MEQKHRRAFFLGVAAGALTVTVLVAVVLAGVRQKGITVRVDTGEIAGMVEAQVREAVLRETPVLLDQLRRETARAVSEEAGRVVASATVDLGGFQVSLPPEVQSRFRTSLDKALAAGMARVITDRELQQVAESMGNRAFVLARGGLDRYLTGRQVMVEPFPGYLVPVRLKPE